MKAGMSFPFRISSTGGVRESSSNQISGARAEEELNVILGTLKYERPMRPSSGNPINQFVFDVADISMQGLIRYHILDLVEKQATLFEIEEEEDITFEVKDNILFVYIKYKELEFGNSYTYVEELGGDRLEKI